jgi:hypothetical protein
VSTITSIFVRTNLTFQDVATRLEQDLEMRFKSTADVDIGSRNTCDALGARFSLFDNHGLEDDMGIEFSRYQYEFDIEIDRRHIDSELSDFYQQYLTLYLLERILARTDWECIAVANLQRILTL